MPLDHTKPTDQELHTLAREWRRTQWNASQSRNARGVFKAERELEAIEKEQSRRRRAE